MEVLARNYYIHQDARAVWLWEALKYKIGADNNTDNILDATAYGIDVRSEHWHLVTNTRTSSKQLVEAELVEDNTPF